jgi:nucleoside-diphosphate-sugar epimerase
VKFTVFGGGGFIGSRLVVYLQRQGHQVVAVERHEALDHGKKLGHVIYAIGLTGDFRLRPYDTVEAHVGQLSKLLKTCDFESWLYLSSTRIYSGLPIGITANEEASIPIVPSADSLYDLSKMLGESICLTHDSNCVRVARLSNVYGYGQSRHTFLGSIIEDLRINKIVTINESPDSCKDYVFVDDIIPLLIKITTSGRRRVYNVASGQLTKHFDLVNKLKEITGCHVLFRPNAQKRVFPQIEIMRSEDEFRFSPSSILTQLDTVIRSTIN